MKMTRGRMIIGGGIVAATAAVAVAGTFVWYTMFMNDAPERVSLSQAVTSVQSSATPAATDSTTAQPSDLTGTWTIAGTGDTFAGYRVNENLARVGSTTAVGRTKNVTGTLQFDGNAITAVQATVDMTALQSDQSMRDNALKGQALETATYPSATFTLTQPIALDSIPADGQQVNVTAVGNLTLHGVTRQVSIPLQAQLTNGYVVVVGSLDIAFADYSIQSPQSMAVLSVEDHGVLELQLVFQKAANQG